MKIDHFKRMTTICSFIIIFLFIGRLTSQILFPVYVTDSLEFTSSNLPIVVIDTHGGTIVDEVRIVADMGIIYNDFGQRNYLNDPFNDYNGKIAIEIRGSTAQMFSKKSYRFETQDSLGNNLNISLLGMPRENDWILYGPFIDQSLMRNVLAYQLSNDMGRYASRTRFCELVINGDYFGLYVLMEKIKRDKYRVNISKMDSSDITGDQLTGGYIIKVDKFAGENIGYWVSIKGTYYQYHYPNPFNSFTTINYNLTKKSHVMLKIYSITGDEIRTLVNEVQNAGKMYATWDGKDNSGKSVSSGVYVYRIMVKNEEISTKMLLIK